jgi:hypothetical protein
MPARIAANRATATDVISRFSGLDTQQARGGDGDRDRTICVV